MTTGSTPPAPTDDDLTTDDARIISNTYDNPARLPTGTVKVSAMLARADALEAEARTLREAVAIMTGVQVAQKAGNFERTLAAAQRLRASGNGHTNPPPAPPMWGVAERATQDIQQQRLEVLRTRLHIGPASLQELNDGLATRGLAFEATSSIGPLLRKHFDARSDVVPGHGPRGRRWVWRLPTTTHATPHAPRRGRPTGKTPSGNGAAPNKLATIIEILKSADHPLTGKELGEAGRALGVPNMIGIANYVANGHLRQRGHGRAARYSLKTDDTPVVD